MPNSASQTYTLTGINCTLNNAFCRRFGKICIFSADATATGNVSAYGDLISGFPAPYAAANFTAFSSTNTAKSTALNIGSDTLIIRQSVAANEVIRVSGVYVTQ